MSRQSRPTPPLSARSTPLPPPPGPAREAAALEAADGLTRAVVAATRDLADPVPPGLGRTLREAAVMAQAGTTAACREPDPLRALRGLGATDHGLHRLGVWIDLARRFGDLPLATALELQEEQTRLRAILQAIGEDWRHGGHAADRPAAAFASLELTVPPFARF